MSSTGTELLSPDRCDVRRYVSDLEEVMIRTLAGFSIQAHRVEGKPGVFIGEGGSLRKIGAVGIHMSRWITSHGLALNVSNRLDLFSRIVPCGSTWRMASSRTSSPLMIFSRM